MKVKLKRIVISLLLIVVGLPLGLVVAAVATGGDALFALVYLIFDRTNGSLVSAGETRKYLLHVPESYDPGKPTALIVSMHGTAAWPAQQQLLSGWSDLADEEGFIVVYPSASNAWTRPPKKWRHFEEPDVQFVSDLIAAIEAEYNIDSTRIYANGISFGGGMAIRLTCRMPGRFIPVESAPSESVARLNYSECASGAEVVLYTVEGGGHTWPGGVPMPESMFGATSDAVNATREAWAFFRAHRLASN